MGKVVAGFIALAAVLLILWGQNNPPAAYRKTIIARGA